MCSTLRPQIRRSQKHRQPSTTSGRYNFLPKSLNMSIQTLNRAALDDNQAMFTYTTSGNHAADEWLDNDNKNSVYLSKWRAPNFDVPLDLNHSNKWTANAWMRGAQSPRGSKFTSTFPSRTGSNNKTNIRKKRKGNVKAAGSDSNVRTFLTEDMEKKLKQVVTHLTKPPRGVIDISGDGPEIIEMVNADSNAGDCPKERHLNFYFRFVKQFSYNACALLMSETMLEFNKARRTLLLFGKFGVKFGAVISQRFEKMHGTQELVSEELVKTDFKMLKELGVEFVLWFAYFKSSEVTPSIAALEANCSSMAKFAASAQKAGLVPVLSIQMEVCAVKGCSSAARHSYEDILTRTVRALKNHFVYLEGLIIRIKVPAFEDGSVVMETRRISNHREALRERDSSYYSTPRSMMISKRVFDTAVAIKRAFPPHIGGVLLENEDTLYQSLSHLADINRYPVPNWFLHVNPCFSHVHLEGVVEQYRKLTKWPPRYLSYHRAEHDNDVLECVGSVLVKNLVEVAACTMGERYRPDVCPI